MSAFANHNFIPHDGRNITLPMLEYSFKKFGNVGTDVAIAIGTSALAIVGPNATSFSLQDIDKHNAIEHDGSLSRNDYYFGDDHDFDYPYFQQASAYFHKPTINVTDGANARLARMTTMMKVNPDFNLTAGGLSASFTEQAFYLSIFGDPQTGIAKSEWVLEWFYAERLPSHLGWKPTVQETNLTTLMAMAKRVMAATPDTVIPPDSDFFIGH
ncbi:hypothetical protein LTR85_002638 [Meristemomyces frigidus]|nr:hypothetical protein LTR85_002638 [Meristemomyces frigidus]